MVIDGVIQLIVRVPSTAPEKEKLKVESQTMAIIFISHLKGMTICYFRGSHGWCHNHMLIPNSLFLQELLTNMTDEFPSKKIGRAHV